MTQLADIKTATEVAKMTAEIDKLKAETRRISRDYALVPLSIGIALGTMLTGVAALVLRTFHVIP